MIRFSRFVKKKTEDGSFQLQCKLKKGKLSGKLTRQLCDALNEALVNTLEPKADQKEN